ncbi:tetratricopeptide repeat protein [Archaeoglobus neptunius]|uniref:tetratricopeptide repeat protein n=1 Tax=Archaeoglobus neptunius TaxID=2798580 RepID=UPI0019251D6B|nr:tetratricopeptide repeat protein [Archaeoglobus neptunius]
MNVEEFIQAFDSARDLSELEKLAEIGREMVDTLEGHEKGRVLGTLGNIYYALQNFEEAEKAYLDVLNLYIKLAEDDKKFLPYVVGCLYNLGNLYQVVRKYEDAEKAYTDALKLVQDDDQKLTILTALGTMYAKLDVRGAAEKCLIEAFNMAKSKGDPRLTGMLLNNLAVVYQREGRKREASMLLKMALDVLDEYGEEVSIAAVLQNFLPLLEESEVEEILERLEKVENLPMDLKAKILYFKAKKAEKEGKADEAAKLYMDAGCLAFLAYRNFGFQSINFMHCFDKVIESEGDLSKDAETLKKLILRYYYGSQKVEPTFEGRAGRLIKAILQGERLEDKGILEDTLKVIADDLMRAGNQP